MTKDNSKDFELQRRQLWIDTYVSSIGTGHSHTFRLKRANMALKEFDKLFLNTYEK